MPVKIYRPTSPGRRDMSVTTFETITRTQPERTLTMALPRKGGRNNQGRITVRHRGGGHKRRYRIIDFKRERWGAPARVASIEYDPNRSARIALLEYEDGEKRYIIAPLGVQIGDTLESGSGADIRPGNALPIRNIPLGTQIHNIELYPGRGAQLVRSAGVSAQLVAKEGPFRAQVRLPIGMPGPKDTVGAAQQRSPIHRHGLSRHDRPGVQSRSQCATFRSVRPAAAAGWAFGRRFAALPWTRPPFWDEAAPARRRRGTFAHRHARPQDTVGAAVCSWQAYPPQQAHRQVYHPAQQQTPQLTEIRTLCAPIWFGPNVALEEIRWDVA